MSNAKALMDKIQALPDARIAEIEDFVEFVAARERERSLTRAATQASNAAFTAMWDNPEDAVYDTL
jgi:hypothetical protein